MIGYYLNISISAVVILLGSGGFLLYDSVAYSGPSQLPEVLGGASLLALGLILCSLPAKLAVRWMRAERAGHHRSSS